MKRKAVLVIEDDLINMKLVRALLKIGDYRVLEAYDAEKGIAVAREHKPDLILMDIQLPVIDGLHATKIIKKDEAIKTIPILALTALAMPGDDKKAMEAGCSGYISKPIDTRVFLDTIAQYIDG